MKISRLLSLIAIAGLVAGVANAETFKLDPAQSHVTWMGSKKIGDTHKGIINVKGGAVELKKGALAGGTITIDMKTITNEDLVSKPDYQKKLVTHLASEDFFNVEKFAESTLKIKSVTKKGDQLIVKGDLTIIGTTQPVEFPATVTTNGNIITGEGKIKINRTKWGLKYGSGNFFKELTADKIINDEFELDFKVVASKS